MTVRLAHITDLHFGAEDPAVVDALRAELNADCPDLVAISGDLTQGARLTEFHQARAFMDSLTSPNLAVPGNHDMSPYNLLERFTDPYRRWRRIISPQTAPQWQKDNVAVLGLNTARRMGLTFDWSTGRVTHHRLRRLLRELDALPRSMTKVVVMHHPLLPPEGAPRTPVAGGAMAALRALESHNVSLVLAGHLHRGYARLSSPDGKPPLILQGATATSVRLRGEPNAYNQITIDESGHATVRVRSWSGTAWTTEEHHSGEPDAPAVEQTTTQA